MISESELEFTQVNGDYIFIYKDVVSNSKYRLKIPLSSDKADKMSKKELRDILNDVEELINQDYLY